MRMTRLLPFTASCTAAIITLLTTGGSRTAEGPVPREHADCAVRNSRIPLPDQPVIYDTAEGPEDSRSGARERPLTSLERGLPPGWRDAGHRT